MWYSTILSAIIINNDRTIKLCKRCLLQHNKLFGNLILTFLFIFYYKYFIGNCYNLNDKLSWQINDSYHKQVFNNFKMLFFTQKW